MIGSITPHPTKCICKLVIRTWRKKLNWHLDFSELQINIEFINQKQALLIINYKKCVVICSLLILWFCIFFNCSTLINHYCGCSLVTEFQLISLVWRFVTGGLSSCTHVDSVLSACSFCNTTLVVYLLRELFSGRVTDCRFMSNALFTSFNLYSAY